MFHHRGQQNLFPWQLLIALLDLSRKSSCLEDVPKIPACASPDGLAQPLGLLCRLTGSNPKSLAPTQRPGYQPRQLSQERRCCAMCQMVNTQKEVPRGSAGRATSLVPALELVRAPHRPFNTQVLWSHIPDTAMVSDTSFKYASTVFGYYRGPSTSGTLQVIM